MNKSLFLSLIAALALLACSPEGTQVTDASSAQTEPVHLLFNARIHTVNVAVPAATAMAWSDSGEILAVGDDVALRAAFPGADARDLNGLTVIPGLIDSHGHLHGLAAGYLQANLTGARSKDEALERLRVHEAKLGEGDWLLGRGWDQNDWPEQVFPDRHDLDRLFPDRPVWLRRIDGHAGWANSAALGMIDRKMEGDWQPTGGFIHRDGAGQATGILVDGAMNLVDPLVPRPSEELMRESLAAALATLSRLGLTGMHDAGAGLEEYSRYVAMIEAGNFPARVYAMADGIGAAVVRLCAEGPAEHPSGRLAMRSVKLYQDGALGSRGAALLADYEDDPGNRGLLFLEPADLDDALDTALGCGLQVGVHAIGDRGNRTVLDAFERMLPRYPENPGRHRIEHAQTLDAADVPRFAALGVIAAMQPTHATSDMYWAGQRLGEDRLRYAYAWRSLLDSGARLSLGSDFPVEEVNPMLGIYAAVTRKDLEGWPEDGWYPGERLGREEALRGFTLDAAYAAFMEDRVGSLEVGKRADFVILDRDLMEIPDDQIPEIRVLETWLDGRRVFLHSPRR